MLHRYRHHATGEEGRIDLDAPVSRYIDSLPAAWQPVTIRQLLTHISGIPNIIDPATSEMIVGGTEDAWAKVQTLPMEFKPGERFSYNQTNYVLLGKIIDKLTGKPFSQFITEQQFDRVGMPVTAASGFNDTYGIIKGSVTLYSSDDGALQHNSLYHVPGFLRTGSGINSTATELARWLIALQQGKLFRSKNTLQTLWNPSVLNNGQKNGWALGWVLQNRPQHFAAGGYGGNRSAFFVYPQDDLAVVLLTNLSGCRPETFIDAVAAYYIPDMRVQNGFDLPAAIKALSAQLKRKGYVNAAAVADQFIKQDMAFRLTENDVNKWGYTFLDEGNYQVAIEIFQLNIHLYPTSGNVYDSLAETYMDMGNKELAIKNYQRSLEFNPKNDNAIVQLRKLTHR